MSRLLLAADDVWVHNDVLAAITDPGTAVDVVSDPKEVVERLQSGLYDLLIVDLQIGAMGGMAVTRAVKDAISRGEITSLAVLMLLDRRVDVFLARRAGAEGWVVKPFTAHELRRVIDSLVGAGV